MARLFVHPKLGEEVRAIGGGYTFTKELLLELDGEQVLALVGVALIDSSCCGTGGCGYALVPGTVVAYKSERGADGAAASRVEPVTDKALRQRIERRLRQTEHVQQVRFATPTEEA